MAGYLAIVLASLVGLLFGGSVLVPLVVCLAPAVGVLRGRVALPAAMALTFVAAVWSVFIVFVVSRYASVPPLALAVVLMLAVAVACAVHLYRRGSRVVGADAVDLAFISAGGIVWCLVLLLATLLPAGAPVSWSMTGDSANNILFARQLLADGGIALGSGHNPVPLTAALIAFFMIPGLSGGISVGAEILALAQMWSFCIVAACMLGGALARALIKRRSALGFSAMALTSLTPLSWILIAGPILLGFVNFHLTLALLCASLIALVDSKRTPVASTVTIMLTLAGVLALWAPLVLIPAVGLVVLVASQGRHLVRLRGVKLAIVVAAALQPAIVFLALSLPALMAQSDLLQQALGAVFEIPKVLGIVVLVAVLGFGMLHVRATRSFDFGRILISAVGGGGAGLAALLWLRRHEETMWSYYQLKYLWLLLALLIILVVVAAMTLASAIAGRSALAALVATSVLVLVGGVSEYARATVPTFSNDPAAMRSPLVSMLTGSFFSVGEGDRVYHRVEELTGSEHKTMLWRSGDPDEDWILFWIIQMAAGGVDDVELRKYAYYHDSGSIDDMCAIRQLMGAPVEVITREPDVVTGAANKCPDLGPVVLVQ